MPRDGSDCSDEDEAEDDFAGLLRTVAEVNKAVPETAPAGAAPAPVSPRKRVASVAETASTSKKPKKARESAKPSVSNASKELSHRRGNRAGKMDG
jgi:hypothetical protein